MQKEMAVMKHLVLTLVCLVACGCPQKKPEPTPIQTPPTPLVVAPRPWASLPLPADLPGLTVRVYHKTINGGVGVWGSGAVIGLLENGGTVIATVAHVVGDKGRVWTCEGSEAQEIASIESVGYERIVFIWTACTYTWDDVFKICPGQVPVEVWTWQQGRIPHDPSTIIPGDSGSAAVSAHGCLTCHASACVACRTALQHSIYSYYPLGFNLQETLGEEWKLKERSGMKIIDVLSGQDVGVR